MEIHLNDRQEKIIEIVKKRQPITGDAIAGELNLTRSTIRPDLTILTMVGMLDARPRVGYFYTGKTSMDYIIDKINSILVDDIKSMPIVIDESTSIYDAIVSMFLENVGSIYIVDDGILSGVVSRKDIIRSIMGGMDLYKIPVGVIMTRMPNVVCIRPGDSIVDAAKKLMDHEIDSLPVIEEADASGSNYRVIGRITKTTITRLFVELGSND